MYLDPSLYGILLLLERSTILLSQHFSNKITLWSIPVYAALQAGPFIKSLNFDLYFSWNINNAVIIMLRYLKMLIWLMLTCSFIIINP